MNPEPSAKLKMGDNVFHRRMDLFGVIVSIDWRLDEDRALVKYEWPWDPDAKPADVPLKELVSLADHFAGKLPEPGEELIKHPGLMPEKDKDR